MSSPLTMRRASGSQAASSPAYGSSPQAHAATTLGTSPSALGGSPPAPSFLGSSPTAYRALGSSPPAHGGLGASPPASRGLSSADKAIVEASAKAAAKQFYKRLLYDSTLEPEEFSVRSSAAISNSAGSAVSALSCRCFLP